MESSLNQAYFDVYSSSKQILRNNQRHLYCNMLDLLSNTCKSSTTAVIGKKLSIEDLSQFWLEDILPLLFDEDVAIQSSAVSALEQGLTTLSVCEIHRSSQWTGIKHKIISTYAPLIHKQRESRNANWHRIWCLLVRILDREILKGASTINSFLSIVELGFRNPDNTVRAEAFLCWRLLIQLFNTHNQLSSPKRLKLICIPLKSSQSKTADGAVVKFRVWWYLISCLGRNLDQHFETVVEAFFTFCIGSPNTQGVIKKYESVRQLALPCLAVLLSREPCHCMQQLLNGHQLENLCQPSPLVDHSVFEKHWKSIANVIVDIIRLLAQEEIIISDIEHQVLTKILKFSIDIMLRLDFAPVFENFCREFITIMPGSSQAVASVINAIALDGLQLSRSLEDFENYAGVLRAIMKLLIAAKAVTAPDVLQLCINQVFTLKTLCTQKNWCAVTVAADILLQIEDGEEYESFEVRLLAWRRVSQTLLVCTKDDEFGCILDKYFNLMDRWILWPLKVYLEFAGRRNISCIDKVFCSIWQELLQIGKLSPERTQYLVDVNGILSKMLTAGHKDLVILNLLDPYATAVLQLNSSTSSKHYENLFNLLIETAKISLSQKTMEVSLNSLLNVLRSLKPSRGFPFFEQIKRALEILMRNATKCDLDMRLFSKWKHAVTDVVRVYPDKGAVDQIVGMLNSSDTFVIIPSVWSLNPDKLTERQKERFSEKTNIPALYNDMSQSQDSLIKPWTPKKIVIAKEKQNEIILGGIKEGGALGSSRPESACLKELNQSSSTNALETEYIDPLISSKMSNRTQRMPNHENVEIKCESNETRKNDVACNMDMGSNIDSTSPLEATHPHSSQSTNEVNMILPLDKEANTNQQNVTEINNFEIQSNDREERTYLLADVYVKKHAIGQTLQSEACNNIDLNLANAPTEEIQSKEVSPKRIGLKSTLLSSPPDRKLTSNSSSPKLRPKPSALLTGRGAQLINMIRNRRTDASQSLQTPITKTVGKNDKIAPTTSTESEHFVAEIISTPSQAKDMLTFSKRLPSPSASPSTSILKRTLRRDSLEESYLDSPACKKKRVSFHDPPVSVTKEYVKDYDGNKTKPKRCLMMDKVHSNAEKSLEARHSLKRRSKLDSITEIERFTLEQRKKYTMHGNNSSMESLVINDNNKTSHMKSNAVENNSSECTNNPCPMPCENPLECKDNLISSKDAFNFVVEHYSIEEILEKHLAAEHDSQIKSINVMLKIISRHMKENSKIKSNVLETLSESHCKEFLDHAIRENLASVVCDRLNLPSVVEYVCEKSKTNAICRNNLFLQVPEIFKHCKQDSELFELAKHIFNNINLTDTSILDLLTVLLNMRSKGPDETANVSEPDIDSSSNL